MNISVFGKYKVKYVNIYSYKTFDDFGDVVFKEDKVNYTRTLEGYDLLKLINCEMSNRETINVFISNDKIQIEQFNPDQGTVASICMKIEGVK